MLGALIEPIYLPVPFSHELDPLFRRADCIVTVTTAPSIVTTSLAGLARSYLSRFTSVHFSCCFLLLVTRNEARKYFTTPRLVAAQTRLLDAWLGSILAILCDCIIYFGHYNDYYYLFYFFYSYGSDLVVVESYQQNNISERLAQEQLSSQPDGAFWLGLMSLDDLSTNTLEAASGSLVPQYAGYYTQHSIITIIPFLFF